MTTSTTTVAVEDVRKGDRILVHGTVYVVGHPYRPISTLVAFGIVTEDGATPGEYLDRVGATVERV